MLLPSSSILFHRFFRICAVLMFTSEIAKQLCLTFLVNKGTYDWWYFPFQLCSIPMYLLLFLSFTTYKKEGRLHQACLAFLMTFGLLGGIAVFADTSGLHYPLAVLTFHSYMWHILLITAGICAGITLLTQYRSVMDTRLCLRYSWRPFSDAVFLYLFACLLAEFLNLTFEKKGPVNLFYINPHYRMEQVVFRDLVPVLGNGTVLLLYIAASIFASGILFFLWRTLFLLSSDS